MVNDARCKRVANLMEGLVVVGSGGDGADSHDVNLASAEQRSQ